MKPKNVKNLQRRSRTLEAKFIDRYKLQVESQSDPDMVYLVDVKFNRDDSIEATCTCEWASNHGVACAHVMAALDELAAMKGRRLSFWLTEDDARRQKHRRFTLKHGREIIWITSRPNKIAV